MGAFGVCKHTSMRARVERQKRRKKKIGSRKRMENTRTLLCFLSIDNSEGREREKGNGIVEKRRATNHQKKYSRRKKRETKLSGDVEYVQKMHTYTYTAAIFMYSLFLN
jgi:hypothetical protein